MPEREATRAQPAETAARAETDRARADAERQLEQAGADAARERDELRAELDRQRADAERERDELRAVFKARAAAIEEARADLRARAGRAEADALRAGLARARAGSGPAPAAGGDARGTRRPGRSAGVTIWLNMRGESDRYLGSRSHKKPMIPVRQRAPGSAGYCR